MHHVRRCSFAIPVVLISLTACERAHPAGPPPVEAASSGTAGPTVRAPSGTNAVAASYSRIDVSWQDNSSNETGFELHRSTTGTNGTFMLFASTAAGVTAYSDQGLAASTQYCYKARAFKKADGKTSYSDFSSTACATTPAPPPPAAPSATTAVPSNSHTVDVAWTDNSANEGGFRVERSLDAGASWAPVATTNANVTSLQDAGRASEQQVCYRIIAFSANGDSPPSTSRCTAPPAAPNELAATAVNGSAVDLAWADHSAVEDGYEVDRSTDGATFSPVAFLPANGTSSHDVGLTADAAYWYRVRATRDGGFSDASNVASATAVCVPTSSTDICDNGLDDDCDGLADSLDPDCAQFDCSGSTCPAGYLCSYSGVCYPHCNDNMQDGDEGDVDCGGSCSAKCQAGQHCWISFDCASGSCAYGICQP
jgi:hypothetical protein